MKSILFICSANKDRSRTAEDHFYSKYPDLLFDSAGTNQKICRQLGTTYVTKEQLDTADRIYVMETKHQAAIARVFGNQYAQKMIVLHIKDIYTYGSKELKAILDEKVSL